MQQPAFWLLNHVTQASRALFSLGGVMLRV